MLKEYFADLHIHIGAADDGTPVKITASRQLNFASIARESLRQKGLDLIGIIDCASPVVIEDIERLLACGEMTELENGGLKYQDQLVILPGAEVESREENGGQAHYLSFFPYLDNLKEFSEIMDQYMTNVNLSTQVSGLNGKEILQIVDSCGGILIPAHVFTPHKSFYGNCFSTYKQVFTEEEWHRIPALELGLSADTYLADYLSQLNHMTFLSNSDAHSLPKIGREYNKLLMAEVNYREFVRALNSQQGRRITGNYGLDPRLGKYHRSYCPECEQGFEGDKARYRCPNCGNEELVVGVKDRIMKIADRDQSDSPDLRPDYVHQIPLLDTPGIGPRTLEKLVNELGTEMDVLHRANREQLSGIVNETLVERILRTRSGRATIKSGGGGTYGKVMG
ncbi:MAG: endonuclease Q family protein [Bacillota bacterium]